jgi:F-type H+-transporting ATPase subunit delta
MSLEEKVLKQISAISDIFIGDKKLNYIMCSPVVLNSDKDKILAALIEATKIDKLVERFLSLLVRKARFNLLGSITEAYSLFFSESRGIKYAEVISSSKLGAEEVVKVQKYLEQRLEKIIKIKSTIDHDLIGGVIVKYDSNLIDCSVSGALERVEKVAKGAQV